MNDEKMKQLKQFIGMIDLLNGMESEQRQQQIFANEYAIKAGVAGGMDPKVVQ